MAGESLLEQAFAETGVQLDRIIDAYERVEPPYVPTGFPIYIQFTNLDDNFTKLVKIDGTFENPTTEYLIDPEGSLWTGNARYGANAEGHECVYIEDISSKEVFYMSKNFEFIDKDLGTLGNYTYEFIDPSTLPQS